MYIDKHGDDVYYNYYSTQRSGNVRRAMIGATAAINVCMNATSVTEYLTAWSAQMNIRPSVLHVRIYACVGWQVTLCDPIRQVTLRSCEIMDFHKQLYTPLPFYLFTDVWMDPLNVLAKFEVHSFTRSRDNSDWSFWVGCEPPILGKGRLQGVGDGTVRKSEAYFLQAPHSNFFSLFTRFRDIAAFVLHIAIFPTPLLVSPKFPHVPLQQVDAFGLRRAKVLG